MRYQQRLLGLLMTLSLSLVGCRAHMSESLAQGLFTWHQGRDLWALMRYEFQLPQVEHAGIDLQLDQLQAHSMRFRQNMVEASPYLYYIYHQIHQRNMPAELLLLPLLESNYHPFAYSFAGATGMWQMMPGTATGWGIKINWWYDGRRDIVSATKAALDYLAYLHRLFDGDWLLAIAAYDCGEGCVKRAIAYNKRYHLATDFWSLNLPIETKQYVPRLLAFKRIIEQPSNYGVRLPYVVAEKQFDIIDVGHQMDLTHAANIAGMTLKALRHMNPGYRRWAMDPKGPYRLVLPIDRIATFKAALKKLSHPKHKPIAWQHYHIKYGDTLGQIAHRYHIPLRLLSETNHLNGKRILHIGQSLLIPGELAMKRPEHIHSLDLGEDGLPGPRQIIHHVIKGQSLNTIAQRYGVSVQSIRFWNKWPVNKAIQPNDQLIIWRASRKKQRVYRVKQGDTLSAIALKFNTKSSLIIKRNNLKGSVIRVGKILQL